jgi:uncharacterized repeat protein (TIGR01451 family)
MKRYLVKWMARLCCLVAASLGGFGPAFADHESIDIDGHLEDLIAAVNNNLGSDKGGFAVNDTTGEIGTGKCPYYINGYDIDAGYVLVDFKNPDGSVSDHTTLYIGIDVTGVIGDVDGNGVPDTFTPGTSCAISDGPAGVVIGPGESYSLQVDLNCDGLNDLRIGVNGDQLGLLGAGGQFISPLAGDYAIANGNLEIRIDNYDQVVENAGGDACEGRMILFANAADDGLGEDRTPQFSLEVPPSVAVTKTPNVTNACPGSDVIWTITVVNDGLCLLDSVAVTDSIGIGHSFVSSNPPSTGDAQIRSFSFNNLAAGASQQIQLVTRLGDQCAAPTLENVVSVNAIHVRGLCGTDLGAFARAVATVNCSQPTCSISPSDTTICTGTSATLCGPTGAGLTYRWTLPDGSIETTRCITSGLQGTYDLRVTDGTGCPSTCQGRVIVQPLPPCSVTPRETTIEPGTTTELCGPSGAGLRYKWTGPGIVDSLTTRCITVGLPGVYTLKVTDAIGCSSTCQGSVILGQTLCRLTGGGCLNELGDQRGHKQHTFGGNVSPLHDGGGPSGNEWQHHVRQQNDILFNFHSHDAHVTDCDLVAPGPCSPHGENTRIFFEGTGQYSIGPGGREFDATFTAIVIDHNEGRCNRGTRDEYTIHVLDADADSPIPNGSVVFEFPLQASDCGNLQIHEILIAPPATREPGDVLVKPGSASDGNGEKNGTDASVILYKPMPNPFTGEMRLAYAVGSAGEPVDIRIYDVTGRLVRTLVNRFQSPGRYETLWDGRNAAGNRVVRGIYFMRGNVGSKRFEARVLYLK